MNRFVILLATSAALLATTSMPAHAELDVASLKKAIETSLASDYPKLDALFCHASQLVETGDWFREFLRTSAEEAGRAAGVHYAESFRRLELGA